MKSRTLIAGTTLLLILLTACTTKKNLSIEGEVEESVGISISPDVPTALPGGGDNTTLTQAAEYAWNQFIALNWPAVSQTGAEGTRDTPNPNARFGDQSGPLVWHTFRSKVELYPWTTHLPPGTTVQDQKLVFNYDAAPQYFYQSTVPPCDGSAGAPVAYVNLDEISQIGLNFMFNGFEGNSGFPASNASDPSLIRFLAKSNRTYSDYINKKGYFNHGSNGSDVGYFQAVTNFTNAIASNVAADTSQVVTFPVGTIMVKSGWRLLSNAEVASGDFHTTTVRYYERKNDEPCYYQQDAVWGMVALHIVQKTPGAPSFTFATFEYENNIKSYDGQAVEGPSGQMNIPPGSLGGNPTNPPVSHTDTPQQTTTTANGSFAQPANNPRLFFKNSVDGLPQAPGGNGGINVNYRRNQIPQAIIDVNQQAQSLINNYNSTNNIQNSPWANYKLVNIQFQPFDKSEINNSNPNRLTSTYRQANIMVETNYTLQEFSGRQTSDGQTSDYTTEGQPVKNIHQLNLGRNAYNTFNMGGCMGCHGNAQLGGSDFSFTLLEGPVIEPEAPTFTEEQVAALRKKYKF